MYSRFFVRWEELELLESAKKIVKKWKVGEMDGWCSCITVTCTDSTAMEYLPDKTKTVIVRFAVEPPKPGNQ